MTETSRYEKIGRRRIQKKKKTIVFEYLWNFLEKINHFYITLIVYKSTENLTHSIFIEDSAIMYQNVFKNLKNL